MQNPGMPGSTSWHWEVTLSPHLALWLPRCSLAQAAGIDRFFCDDAVGGGGMVEDAARVKSNKPGKEYSLPS